MLMLRVRSIRRVLEIKGEGSLEIISAQGGPVSQCAKEHINIAVLMPESSKSISRSWCQQNMIILEDASAHGIPTLVENSLVQSLAEPIMRP